MRGRFNVNKLFEQGCNFVKGCKLRLSRDAWTVLRRNLGLVRCDAEFIIVPLYRIVDNIRYLLAPDRQRVIRILKNNPDANQLRVAIRC